MIALCQETSIFASARLCFDLSRSVDLHLEAVPEMQTRATAGRQRGLSEPGDVTTWSALFFGIRFSLTTKITRCASPRFYADEMVEGPFRSFCHRYSFTPLGEAHTLLTDNFSFESPLQPMGSLIDQHLLKPKMTNLLETRLQAIKEVAESDNWRNFLP